MSIYENIKEIADRKGLSIRQVETKAKVGNGSIARWKTQSPSVHNLQKVAKALGVGLTRLLR